MQKRNTLFGTTLENVSPESLDQSVPKSEIKEIEKTEDQIKYEKYFGNVKNLEKEIEHIKEKKLNFENDKNCFSDYVSEKKVGNSGRKEKENKLTCQFQNADFKLKTNNVNPMMENVSPRKAPVCNGKDDRMDRLVARHRYIDTIRRHMPPSTIMLSKSKREIPRNICHQFRYNVCDSLLDAEHLDHSIKNNNNNQISDENQQSNSENDKLVLSDYEHLGLIIRSNVLPGSSDHRIEPIKTSYCNEFRGWDTFRSRDKSLPDLYRMRIDEFGKWSEATVVANRISREWETQYMEQLNKRSGGANKGAA